MKRVLVCLLALFSGSALFAAELPYNYARVGSHEDATTATRPGVVMMGGGNDVDAAFAWLCRRSGGGDMLVIRTRGGSAYNPYIQSVCGGVNSVATLIVPTREAANDAFVRDTVLQAEAVWIAGGDQAEYLNKWSGTALQKALNTRLAERMPIGGTSAGLAVLGQFIYSAQAPLGVTSDDALQDPFHPAVSLDRDFVNLPYLKGVLAESHFNDRHRMGRNVAFLCRLTKAPLRWTRKPKGISVDAETALLIDGNGRGTVVGKNRVYLLTASRTPKVCESGAPLTYPMINVIRLQAGDAIDLAQWPRKINASYTVSVTKGILHSNQPSGSAY